jgi:hypothetical protein
MLKKPIERNMASSIIEQWYLFSLRAQQGSNQYWTKMLIK